MDKTLVETSGKAATNDARMQWEKGYLWEVSLSKAFAEKVAIRIGELSLDGISMSPDGVSYDDDKGFVVEEYKCTAMSPDKSPAEVVRWMMQVKGYCKAVGTTKCVFRILHLAFVPVYKVWEITFTRQEIDENWEAITNHARTMKGGPDD